VQASPANHPERPVYLSNLSNALRLRFGRSGAAGDLDAAITFWLWHKDRDAMTYSYDLLRPG
jgi:hypothetical protein